MKRVVSVLSLALAILVAASGCAANGGLNEVFSGDGKNIVEYFGEECSCQTILDDLKNLDMNHEPSYAGLSHTSALNQDTNTVVHQYFDGEKLVYQVYENYGEEGFTYYTQSVSGKELEVSYYTEEGKINSVAAKSDDYTVLFENPDSKMPCGAEKVYITATKKGDTELPETISYEIDGKTVSLSSTDYYGDGEYRFYTSDVEKNKISSEGKGIKFEKSDSEPDSELTQLLSSAAKTSRVQTILGEHVFSYKNTDKGMKWFMKCGAYVIFDSEDEARKFVADNNLKVGTNVFVGSAYSVSDRFYVEFRDVYLAVADSFEYIGKGINEFVFEEFDDKSFADISFNADGEITGLKSDNSILSVY